MARQNLIRSHEKPDVSLATIEDTEFSSRTQLLHASCALQTNEKVLRVFRHEV
jgi:hypothetical protein